MSTIQQRLNAIQAKLTEPSERGDGIDYASLTTPQLMYLAGETEAIAQEHIDDNFYNQLKDLIPDLPKPLKDVTKERVTQ